MLERHRKREQKEWEIVEGTPWSEKEEMLHGSGADIPCSLWKSPRQRTFYWKELQPVENSWQMRERGGEGMNDKEKITVYEQ